MRNTSYRTQLDVGVAVIVIDWTDDFAIHWRSIGNWELGVGLLKITKLKFPKKKKRKKFGDSSNVLIFFSFFPPTCFFQRRKEENSTEVSCSMCCVQCTVSNPQSVGTRTTCNNKKLKIVEYKGETRLSSHVPCRAISNSNS